MLISDPHQKQTSFRTVNSHLSDDLIETLTEEFLSNWTNSFGSGLSVL